MSARMSASGVQRGGGETENRLGCRKVFWRRRPESNRRLRFCRRDFAVPGGIWLDAIVLHSPGFWRGPGAHRHRAVPGCDDASCRHRVGNRRCCLTDPIPPGDGDSRLREPLTTRPAADQTHARPANAAPRWNKTKDPQVEGVPASGSAGAWGQAQICLVGRRTTAIAETAGVMHPAVSRSVFSVDTAPAATRSCAL